MGEYDKLGDWLAKVPAHQTHVALAFTQVDPRRRRSATVRVSDPSVVEQRLEG
jgi:hypothetical protein